MTDAPQYSIAGDLPASGELSFEMSVYGPRRRISKHQPSYLPLRSCLIILELSLHRLGTRSTPDTQRSSIRRNVPDRTRSPDKYARVGTDETSSNQKLGIAGKEHVDCMHERFVASLYPQGYYRTRSLLISRDWNVYHDRGVM